MRARGCSSRVLLRVSCKSWRAAARMPRKRSHKGYTRVASEDLDDAAAEYAPDSVPVPRELQDFDPKVRHLLALLGW
eukprot:COSAG01_NODE_306_length_19162_cov_14.196611_12_plen_77_part_00